MSGAEEGAVIEEFLAGAEDKMHKTREALQRELASIRTGRASPHLLDRVTVDYYGTPTPVNQLATITAPEARLLVVQPWERQSLASIERAILKSDLGINPNNDGHVIRLVIPELTEERRRELVKVLGKRVEESKVAVRNVRREVAERLRALEKDKQVSEDDHRRATERLQKLTDQLIGELERVGQQKERELLES